MLTNYQYKLLPTADQSRRMTRWLKMLRHQYNWLLAERFDWWEHHRCSVNACPLTCSIAEPRERPEYYGQKRSLVQLKQEREWYKDIHAHVLQEIVKRVDLAFSRFVKGDCNGNRSGKPRFKGKNRYRTFKFPAIKADCIQGNRVTLPKLGAIKFIQHRPIPDGFKSKGAMVTLKADGWYVTLVLEDKTVPTLPEVLTEPTMANSIGVDAGLEYFIACSDASTEQPAKFYRQAQEKLGKLQAKREKRPKRSKARRKFNQRVARLHQKITRQRRQWHFEVAGRLLDKADVVFTEKLRVKNMARKNKPKPDGQGGFAPNGQAAKSGLNQSFADAGISGFLNDILPYKAAKAGKRVIQVNPAGTSQHCAICLNRVPKELADRWHDCPDCGVSMPRDVNSGILIHKVGLGIVSLKNAKSRQRDGEARALCLA